MTENFDTFNAPQFFDFSKDLHQDENVDAYFDIDHENAQHEDPVEDPLKIKFIGDSQGEDAMAFYTPLKATPANTNDHHKEYCKGQPRRSLSVGDLKLLYDSDCEELEINSNPEEDVSESVSKHLEINNKPEEDVNTSVSNHLPKKNSSNNLRKAGSDMSLNKGKAGPIRISAPHITRAASKENLNRLAKPKRYGSTQNLNQGNYVSMAEAVRKFQSGTPIRFRTKPKPEVAGRGIKLGTTYPQSPALIAKDRHRPVQAISREEQERQEFEEAQKFKIKANPLNKRVLQGPIKPMIPVEKKPVTRIEPFNITAVRKVVESPKKEAFEFHAKPVPKGIYEPPKIKETQKTRTVPHTPTFMKRYAKESAVQETQQTKHHVKLAKTVPVPFSFEGRDLALQKKKEEMIKKVFEEEKKAREFHARPAPKAKLNSAKSSGSLVQWSNCSILPLNNVTKSDENLTTQFKARPPAVLYKKPFEPKKERHLIEISEFQLNTEKRAKEREEFEQIKKEKAAKIALLIQQEEELRLQREQEEEAKLRKEIEFKAKPIKKYKEIIIQPSGKVTEPISPKFHTNKYKINENKENLN